jgi:hypothetical protein
MVIQPSSISSPSLSVPKFVENGRINTRWPPNDYQTALMAARLAKVIFQAKYWTTFSLVLDMAEIYENSDFE